MTGVPPGHDVGAVAQHLLDGADVSALPERGLGKSEAEEVPMETSMPFLRDFALQEDRRKSG